MMMMMIMKVMRVMAASKESNSDKSKYTYVGKATLESEDDDRQYVDSAATDILSSNTKANHVNTNIP
jgi:Flp pilus assembly protein CpaB